MDKSERSSGQRTVGLLIENLSPVLFTLAITLMGVEIAPEHPWLGFVSISAAVAIYGVRAAILQVRYARSQEELTKAMIATEQASRAKSQFLANMSHEIRTPMNGILGMTELALSTALSEEQRDFLLTVKSSADRLLSIINEILDYSKMEAGKTILDSVAFHLPGLVKDVLRSFAFPAHQKGLELAVHIAPDVPADLIGDPIRLSQVLINLVGNAIKFTEHGEVCADVSLEAVTNGRACLQFSIRDTGIGIPLDQQGALFQEFQQAHTSGNRLYGGTGLGLAVSKSIVTLMGGAIALKSVPGEGTTITFHAHFDVSPGSPAALPIPSEEDLHGTPTLIIDDNATNRRILSELARQWKMEPQVCDSGESGLAELSRAAHAGTPYRLVLLDEQMPGIDGLAVLERIRGNPAAAKCGGHDVDVVRPGHERGTLPGAGCGDLPDQTHKFFRPAWIDSSCAGRADAGKYGGSSSRRNCRFLPIAKDPAGRRQPGESTSRHDDAGQDGPRDHAGNEWSRSFGAMETK